MSTRADHPAAGHRPAALILAILSFFLPPALAWAQAPQFAGRWELNVQASDPPRDPSAFRIGADDKPGGDEGRRGGRWNGGEGGGGERWGGAGMGGGGIRGGGMGGAGMRGGGMGGREMGGREMRGSTDDGRKAAPAVDTTASRQEMERAFDVPRALIIVQHEDEIRLTDDQGLVTVLKPDGKKVDEDQAGGNVQRTTQWNDGALVTTTTLVNGVNVTQTYTRTADGRQLIVVTRVEGGRSRKPVEMKRVYDQALQWTRAPGSRPQASCRVTRDMCDTA